MTFEIRGQTFFNLSFRNRTCNMMQNDLGVYFNISEVGDLKKIK